MLKRIALASALLLFQDPVFADTPLDIIGVEKSVNDVARRAQETGDQIAKAFAQQAIIVISEWKRANESLINHTLDRIDEESRRTFTNINNIATRLQAGQAVAVVDIQRAMAGAAGIVSALPLTNQEPGVSFVFPTILTPGTEGTASVHLIGAKIADANPKISGEVPIKKYTDHEVGFDISRDSLKFEDGHVGKATFKLSYDVSKSRWYNPFSWWSVEERTRDVELTLLPRIPGSVELKKIVRSDSWETTVDGPHIVGGVGQDNTYRTGYHLTPKQIEEGWNIDKVAQEKAKFDDNNGDGDGGSSCTGWDPARFDNTFAGFNIQHGHKTSGFSKSDAHQNCRIWIALKRKKQIDTALPPETKALHWSEDTDFDIPENTTAYAMKMTLYTGQGYTITKDDEIPYSLFQIIKNKTTVKFRPLPQREF